MTPKSEETKYGFEDYADEQLDEIVQKTSSTILRGPFYHAEKRLPYVVLRHNGKIRILEYAFGQWKLRT